MRVRSKAEFITIIYLFGSWKSEYCWPPIFIANYNVCHNLPSISMLHLESAQSKQFSKVSTSDT